MKYYDKTRKTLDALQALNSSIWLKKEQRKGAIEFNKMTVLGNQFDIQKITEEIQEMELEFKRKTREL